MKSGGSDLRVGAHNHGEVSSADVAGRGLRARLAASGAVRASFGVHVSNSSVGASRDT